MVWTLIYKKVICVWADGPKCKHHRTHTHTHSQTQSSQHVDWLDVRPKYDTHAHRRTLKTIFRFLYNWTEHIHTILNVYIYKYKIKPIEKALGYKIIIIVKKRTAAPIDLLSSYVCAVRECSVSVCNCCYIMDSKRCSSKNAYNMVVLVVTFSISNGLAALADFGFFSFIIFIPK